MRRVLLLLVLFQFIGTTPLLADYDRSQFCRPNASEVLILVDITTALDARARQLLSDGIREIVEGLNPGESLRIATIADQVTHSEMLMSGCVPYCPDDLGTILLGNCTEGLLRLETRHLRKQMADVLRARLETTADLPYSDILRTLNATVAARTPGRHLKLYVFSDMIENSEYVPGRDFWSTSPAKLNAKLVADGLMPDFSNTSIFAFGIGRGGSGERKALPQPRMKALSQFWTAYFEQAGANSANLSEALTLY
jgi:hypothetical protein